MSPRAFGLQVGSALLVFSLILALRGTRAWVVLFAPAVVLLLAAWVTPDALGLAARGWHALSRALDRVTSPITLRVVYYGLVVPFAAFAHREDRVGWQAPPAGSGRVAPTELGLLAELWELLRDRKRLWLVPLVVVLVLFGLLLLLAESTALLPFLYPLF